MVEAMPWIRPEHIPLVRQWCELEEIRRAMFAGIVQLPGTGIIRIDAKAQEVSVRRLVHDHRQIAQTQLLLENALLMTPASRAALSAGDNPTDLVSLMASAAATEAVEPEAVEPEPPAEDPPDDQPPVEDPPPDKESPTEPDNPAPMKSR